jgi:hypothetical protein
MCLILKLYLLVGPSLNPVGGRYDGSNTSQIQDHLFDLYNLHTLIERHMSSIPRYREA